MWITSIGVFLVMLGVGEEAQEKQTERERENHRLMDTKNQDEPFP